MQTRRDFGRKVAGAGAFKVLAVSAAAQQTSNPKAPEKSAGGRGSGGDAFGLSPEGSPLPGQKWKVHDRSRPQPRKVTPGLPIAANPPPSDAIILFAGTDLSQWVSAGRGGVTGDPRWKVENGYVEMTPGVGSLATKAKFGDCQLHVEWETPPPADPDAKGQMRGNSGILLMGRYEIQVLSSYENLTYADGMAGAIYGLYPPLVNPSRPEGEWNSYDIFFEAPRFENAKVVKPAYITLIFNGVLVQHRAELIGSTSILPIAQYRPHAPEESLVLQGHRGPARFRNIWIRRLSGYDQ